MATFPNTLSNKTTLERVSQVRQSQAVDGTMRYLDLGGTAHYRITCVVEGLTGTERDTLMAWLETNETTDIDVTIAATTYRGRLLGDAPVTWRGARGLFDVYFGLWALAL